MLLELIGVSYCKLILSFIFSGFFSFDQGDGEVRYETVIDATGFSVAQLYVNLERSFKTSQNTFIKYAIGIPRIEGGESPESVVAELEA